MIHYEISPREREDEARLWEHDFGVTQLQDQDEQDKASRRGGTDAHEQLLGALPAAA